MKFNFHSKKRQCMLHLGILFLAVMGLYLQTLLFGFSPLDDPGLIESELIWLKNP